MTHWVLISRDLHKFTLPWGKKRDSLFSLSLVIWPHLAPAMMSFQLLTRACALVRALSLCLLINTHKSFWFWNDFMEVPEFFIRFRHNKHLNFTLEHFKRRSFVNVLLTLQSLGYVCVFMCLWSWFYSWFCNQTQGKGRNNQAPSV